MNPEIVEYLTRAACADPTKPELPTYGDAASFITGIEFATKVMEYAIDRANQRIAFEAMTKTTLVPPAEYLEAQATKIGTAENIRNGLVKGLALLPVAVERVEKIKAELPSDALLN
ncbi:hypothetical protein [Xanthobacter wiegelii]|uniref:hypothetical protein n=1 Tax=Xanthobacter wiegelii TaxID=3119913 RepID=UPI0037263426